MGSKDILYLVETVGDKEVSVEGELQKDHIVIRYYNADGELILFEKLSFDLHPELRSVRKLGNWNLQEFSTLINGCEWLFESLESSEVVSHV